MKQLSLLAIGCALLIFTGCTFSTKNKIEKKQDSVNVETKVTMICLPDFPTADQVYILDVIA